FADFSQVLIAIARPLYADDPLGVDLVQALYALDSTTIDLSLSVFPWARFRKHKGAVKMHTLLDLRGNIPTFIRITDGKVHDVNILGRTGDRGWGLLCNGSWLHRFPAASRVHALAGLLRGTHQGEHTSAAPLFASGRQKHRRALRPDR